MKSVWNGSISFGLVNIPIKLYSAVESKGTKFKLLHKKNHSPIHYKRWCEECKKEVEWKDIEKGFEIAKGEYYVVSKEELEKIKPKSTDTIEIVQFIDMRELDPIYVSSHYFIGPETSKEKPYFLFREILQGSAKSAIGTFVMREKEHICAIEAYKEGLLLSLLNFSYEIRDISEIEELKTPPKISKEELDLGKQLIERLAGKSFNIAKFKDTFSEQLSDLIKKKARGESVKITEKSKVAVKEKNLVEALKASLK